MELTVNLPHHDYALHFVQNQLPTIGTWLSKLWEAQKVVIVTDTTVAELYAKTVKESLLEAGFDPYIYAVVPGETSKSLHEAEKLYHFFAEVGLTRKDGVLALGGGVVGDLTGFVASTYMRGLHFVQVPTTLLAQVDSSIGGKTAVNTSDAKNIVGTFAQPDGVFLDAHVLKTLETRRICEGIAEIVKSAAIRDVALWNRLGELEDELDLLSHAQEIVYACCQVKKKVVEADEFDTGERLILNFGHTIGHAIEQTMGYGVVTHGEAVSIGMVQISQVAENLGWMPSGITHELKTMLAKFHLPLKCTEWNEQQLYDALTHDKKAAGKTIRIVLLNQIGEATIRTIALTDMKEFLKLQPTGKVSK